MPVKADKTTSVDPLLLMLDGDPEAVRSARDFAYEVLRTRGRFARVEDVVLTVSELVTNAVRYGTEPGEALIVSLDVSPKRVRVEVYDRSRDRPYPGGGLDDERGRGLLIVNSLAESWGVDDLPDGKRVWAELP
ncbi:ATP-binding protein [Streptomyces sp. NRRL F-5126]|uniref:ATP-binding protein n=1 Tax=Streptomyces sp. NRRL F-5126 TaxID=1463857 RepID=UPI00099D2BCF|nr:ATP-binding protein [Streptomyces sp. NRRL F-5126]